ncbi:hypothetical protein SAMN05518672_103538 [Chitinophaga sp. CF118]|uniref:hypothetical protein n=1 Tax=Chitinophaga sp. CF118 TaxID=1884367 RepID=UPI0008F2E8D0|nr:hypothetical protein [Chitinophaga sp. CF118]SFD85636.1 hypothetical protein SAMN05518672_103538 [Chitinophaga sp. CF118]
MKSFVVILLAMFFCNQVNSQSLDQGISDIASDIAQKVSKKNKVRLALTDFVNSEGKVDALTDYVRKELELKLINAENLQVMDRKHIKLLLSDNNLQKDGLIDESIAKSSTSFIKVDGWVIAEITTVGNKIKVKVTVSDVITSLMYAASSAVCNGDDLTVKNLLDPEVKVCNVCNGKGTIQVKTICATCGGKGNRLCRRCAGNGKVESNTWSGRYERCEECNGTGKNICNICEGRGKVINYDTCPKCNGKNMGISDNTENSPTEKDICSVCMGSGKMNHRQNCTVCAATGKLVVRGNLMNCSNCNGTGISTTVTLCTTCNGTGKL